MPSKPGADAVITIEVPYVVLDSIGVTEYLVAIDHIRRQEAVGFSLAGSHLGRRGRLSWVVVGTPTLLFLFDVFSMGNAGFKHGLKELCESESLVKVMHDSRHAADMLRRQFNVNLVNVFDVQVADMVVESRLPREIQGATASLSEGRPTSGPWPKTLASLAATCEKYLRVASLSADKIDAQRLNSDTWWFLRPPTDDHLRHVAKETLYLLALKDKLEEKLSTEFRCAVDVFQGSVKEARLTKNPDESTGPLARPFAPLTRSLARSLRSLPTSWDSD